MAEDIQLIKVNKSNYQILSQLHFENFRYAYRKESYEAIVRAEIAFGYIAYYQGNVAGEVVGEYEIEFGKMVLYIASISVREGFRKNGIGSALINKIIECGADTRAIFLHVRKSNTVAQAFYHKHGFEEVRVVPNYYHSENEDGLVYRKVIYPITTPTTHFKVYQKLTSWFHQDYAFGYPNYDPFIVDDLPKVTASTPLIQNEKNFECNCRL